MKQIFSEDRLILAGKVVVFLVGAALSYRYQWWFQLGVGGIFGIVVLVWYARDLKDLVIWRDKYPKLYGFFVGNCQRAIYGGATGHYPASSSSLFAIPHFVEEGADSDTKCLYGVVCMLYAELWYSYPRESIIRSRYGGLGESHHQSCFCLAGRLSGEYVWVQEKETEEAPVKVVEPAA
jgi:hypothetical protein